MHSRAIASGGLSACLLLSAAIALASPVNAQSLTIDCSTYAKGSIVSTSADAGETITFTLVNCDSGNSPFIAPYTAGITDPQFTGIPITTNPQVVSDYSIAVGTPDGNYSNVFRLYDDLSATNVEIYISVTVPRQASPVEAQPFSGPEAVQQQFGQTSTATCNEAASSDLNWAGVPNGGWGESWARWMNNGLGGPICTRTLVYSNAQGRWVIGE